MEPLVSIIIPVYNHQEALMRALDSIEKQTHKNVEVIVVDDGSDEEVHSSQFLVQLIRQETGGAPAARNRGLQEAKGEYVIFWDADVTGEVDMLEKMVGVLQSDSKASFAYSNFRFGQKKMPAQQFNSSTIRQLNYIHSTSLIRRSDAIQWDESLKRFQDWDLWLMMNERGKHGVWIDEYLFHVDTGGTMSTWLPSFAYKKPWCWLPGVRGRVSRYEQAKLIISKKHNLNK